MRRFLQSFVHAYDGIVDATRVQPNLGVHWIVAAVAIFVAVALRVALWAFVVIVALAAVVLAFELVNTALEALVDLATREIHPLAKRAKDAAAGAVLVASIGAALCGAVIIAVAAGQGYRPQGPPALDAQTIAAAVAVPAALSVPLAAWLRPRVRGRASLLWVLPLWGASICLCLLAHDARML